MNVLRSTFPINITTQMIVCAVALITAVLFANNNHNYPSIRRYAYCNRFYPRKVLWKNVCPGSSKYGNMFNGKEKRQRRVIRRRLISKHKPSTEIRRIVFSAIQDIRNALRQVVSRTSFSIKLLCRELMSCCWWIFCTGIALGARLILVVVSALLLFHTIPDLLLYYMAVFVLWRIKFVILQIVTTIFPAMTACVILEVTVRVAFKYRFKPILPSHLKSEGLVRVYNMITEPLYVVSPEDQARKERRREQHKLAQQRKRAKDAMESAAQSQVRKDNDRERKKRRRAEETEEETEARLKQKRDKWAASNYAANQSSKRAKTRMTESHEEMMIRKEAKSLHNSPEKKEMYNSSRCNKRKAETAKERDVRRASDRIRIQELRQTNAKNKRIIDRIWSLMKTAARALHATRVNQPQCKNRGTTSKKTGRTHRARVCLICDCFVTGVHPNGVPSISGSAVKEHSDRLGVKSYEDFHKVSLHPDLIKQYEVKRLEGMLLSPHATKLSRNTFPFCIQGI